ncbi:putative dimethylaniline monooxygenase [Xylariales sp. PMI_506]|nr:putative dimethylaniline monooxygenase [Xylariales sp. PMI_506]
MAKVHDLVVVGAGWYGLGAARAYIETHPDDNIIVLEANDSVGGTWAKNRLYPGLKSNNMLGSYEFPDFPMSPEIYGVKELDHIPGAVLHKYLNDFAQKVGIYPHIQFNTAVDLVEPTPSGGWKLTVKVNGEERTVETTKLILATGLTSTPNMPVYEGSQDFGRPIFHAKDFCRRAPELEGVKSVVVVGGAKSAYDVAYAVVESGAEVDMIIRPNGQGPVWIAPRFVTPLKKRIDTILNVRFMSWFSPCPWGQEDGYPRCRRLLHNTWVGQALVRTFWTVMGGDILSNNKYDSHPELKKLKPWQSVFWTGSGLSILNFNTSFFDLVRQGKVRVHVDNIDHLEPGKVILTGGQTISAGAIVCSTGWKKESTIKFQGLPEQGLGLPFSAAEQTQLNAEYDKLVLQEFPILSKQPVLTSPPETGEPLRYYRFIVPPAFVSAHNLAFSGMVSTVSTAICAASQGLWISAYFDGKLEREAKSQEELTQEVMMHTQWGKWRYPCGYGAALPDFVFEGIPYVDMLLRDLGLKTHRKETVFKELTSPYTPVDYNGVLDEWKAKLALGKK